MGLEPLQLSKPGFPCKWGSGGVPEAYVAGTRVRVAQGAQSGRGAPPGVIATRAPNTSADLGVCAR